METNSRIVRQWVPTHGQIEEIERRVAGAIIMDILTRCAGDDPRNCMIRASALMAAIRQRYGVVG